MGCKEQAANGLGNQMLDIRTKYSHSYWRKGINFNGFLNQQGHFGDNILC